MSDVFAFVMLGEMAKIVLFYSELRSWKVLNYSNTLQGMLKGLPAPIILKPCSTFLEQTLNPKP